MPDHLPFAWRISRYETELRARGTEWESWTDISDVGKSFNGLTLAMEEYLRVENQYVDAAIRIARDATSDPFLIRDLGYQDAEFALREGQPLVPSDMASVVRGNLRGRLDCGLVSADGACDVSFGYDLYMYVEATTACERAVEEVERGGLCVEHGVRLPHWDKGE